MIRPLKRVDGTDVKKIVLANYSAAYGVAIGDAIQQGGTGYKFAVPATATSPILGIVVGLLYNGSKVTERSSITYVNAVSSISGPGTDNETSTAGWSVEYIPAYVPMEYEADINNVAATTNANSAGIGTFFNLPTLSATQINSINTNGQLDEASYAIFSGTAGQFVSFGYTPYNTKKVFCRINKAD